MDGLGFWCTVGALAAFCGLNCLDVMRRNGSLRPVQLYAPVIAGITARLHFGELAAAGGLFEVTAWMLVFCAVSPAVGFIWWGRNGRIRRWLLTVLALTVLTGVGTLLWARQLGVRREALVLGFGSAVIVLLPFRRWLRRLRWSFRARRESRRLVKETARLNPDRAPAKAVGAGQARAEQAAREVKRLEERISKLEHKEGQETARLAARRREIAEQERLIRLGEDGLRFHPEFGFIMAEAWRTLRAEIAAGERVPAIEHEEFFRQAVEELLSAPDFEARYLHEPGRVAMAALNGHLAGEKPLPWALERILRLHWQPQLLAPRLPAGELPRSIVEAWLVPHRRLQQSAWEAFLTGEHSRQEEIAAALKSWDAAPEPALEEWRSLWDEHPAAFISSAAGGSVGERT
jgi:hypothetical protein